MLSNGNQRPMNKCRTGYNLWVVAYCICVCWPLPVTIDVIYVFKYERPHVVESLPLAGKLPVCPILQTLHISRYNIRRYCTQHDNFYGKTSVTLWTLERRPYLQAMFKNLIMIYVFPYEVRKISTHFCEQHPTRTRCFFCMWYYIKSYCLNFRPGNRYSVSCFYPPSVRFVISNVPI